MLGKKDGKLCLRKNQNRLDSDRSSHGRALPRLICELGRGLLRAGGDSEHCVKWAETSHSRQQGEEADPAPVSLGPNEDKREESETDKSPENTLDGVFRDNQEILHMTSKRGFR